MPTVLYVLFALAFMPLLIAATTAVLRAKQFGHIDNNYPRKQQAEMQGIGARLNAAQANSWEALTFFSVVVFIAYASGLPLVRLDTVAIVFLVMRFIHFGVYALNWATVRTLVFYMCLLCCIYIFYLAASH
ncbi:MAG TPA: MAPEG family protein [Rhodocyclaceae bacterium]|jgi:uncharacterized MAPEG superfamily protein|nr:MAPEG family protein [Rhodocyclaceae bacterium]